MRDRETIGRVIRVCIFSFLFFSVRFPFFFLIFLTGAADTKVLLEGNFKSSVISKSRSKSSDLILRYAHASQKFEYGGQWKGRFKGEQ